MFLQFVFFWLVVALLSFFLSLKVAAPYGRHSRSGWGKMIDNKLGWVIMELPALLIAPVLFFIGETEKNLAAYILISLFIIHYFNRVIIFPFRLKTKGKKMPIFIVASAFFFNLVNGFIIGYELGFRKEFSAEWIQDPRFGIGILIFLIGMFINHRSDQILISLRQPGEKDYKIPKGFLFEYISCPNHFGEIIEWIGFAIMAWSFPIASFAIWTAANLIPRSLKHHQWYFEKFEDYPQNRKAVIPFVV